MYNIKVNSSRKENYKYNKQPNSKKRQTGSHYHPNKYNKYKPRHNNSESFHQNIYEYDSTSFYKKDSKKIKKIKKKDLIEVNESFPYNIEDPELKENSSSHENSTLDNQPLEKTMEKSDKLNFNSYNNFDDDKSLTNEQDLNSSENNTIIYPNRNSLGRTNSQIFSDDKENMDNNMIVNNSQSYSNLNLNKAKSNNIKENLSNILSSINLSSDDFKEAFYVPRKRSNNLFSNNNDINENININNINNLNNINIQQGNKFNEIQKAQQLNLILNNNNNNINNNNNYLFYNQNININRHNSNNIEQIQPFNVYDSHSSNSLHHRNSCDSFRSSIKSGSILDIEREKENTDILEIHVKISQKETLVFKIRRYDDMFKTVKIFCEINKLDIKLIRPLIIYIIKALNSIYGIYNLKLKNDEIQFLKEIKKEFYHEKENDKNNEYLNDKSEEDFSDEEYYNLNYQKDIYNY